MDFTKPRPNAILDAKRAREERKRKSKLALRDNIEGVGLINDVILIAGTLQHGTEPVRQQDGTWVDLSIDRTRVSTLKASADLKLKLLNKVLPDLANIQLAGDVDKPLTVILSPLESKL